MTNPLHMPVAVSEASDANEGVTMFNRTAIIMTASLVLAGGASAGMIADDPDGFVLRSGKNITLRDRSSVTGSVGAMQDIIIRSGATVSGFTVPESDAFSITSPAFPDAGTSNLSVTWDATETVAPGVYGKFNARDRSTITFTAGDYVFESFTLGYSAKILADTSQGDEIGRAHV